MTGFRADRNPDYNSGPTAEKRVFKKETWRTGSITHPVEYEDTEDGMPITRRVTARVIWCCYMGPDPKNEYRMYYQMAVGGGWQWWPAEPMMEPLRAEAEKACFRTRRPIGRNVLDLNGQLIKV